MNGVYSLRPVTKQILSNTSTADSTLLLHGHPSSQHLSFLTSTSRHSKIKKLLDSCDVCLRAKQTRSSFLISGNKASDLFQLIHCDLWGPYSTSSLSGAHYFLSIVDDHSRAIWIYLIDDKSEVAGCMKFFCSMVKTQFNKQVKIISTDNGTEFINSSLKDFYKKQGILIHTSCVGPHNKTGVSKENIEMCWR